MMNLNFNPSPSSEKLTPLIPSEISMINLTPLKISGNLNPFFPRTVDNEFKLNPSPSGEKLTPLIPSEILMINLTPLKISGNLNPFFPRTVDNDF